MNVNRVAVLTKSPGESGSRQHIKLSGLKGIAKYLPGIYAVSQSPLTGHLF